MVRNSGDSLRKASSGDPLSASQKIAEMGLSRNASDQVSQQAPKTSNRPEAASTSAAGEQGTSRFDAILRGESAATVTAAQ